MKKILFLCDGDNFPKGAFELIKMINSAHRVMVKGIFFAPIDFQQLINLSYIPIAKPYMKLEENEKRLVNESKKKFIAECDTNHIAYMVNAEAEEWDRELMIKETLFSDIVVISEELFCSDVMSYQPNAYMKELLHGSECPAMVVPENFKAPERIVVAYDGKKESVLALKQFGYLFPEFTELPTEFVYIKNEKNNDIPNLGLLREYTKIHFNSPGVEKLHFEAKEYFTTWAEAKKNILLIAGSYGRSAVSDLMHRSFAEEVIHEHKIPLFIAHHT
ncbi:MAG: universal stress protein [Bacteroidetes bacterium]|nr:universal stress protein [Bacteroidota bacterium]